MEVSRTSSPTSSRVCQPPSWLRRIARACGLFVVALSFVWIGPSEQVRFAVIGDYGLDNSAERQVANLVRTNLQPEFIVTVGDNNYLSAEDTDRAIGKYYHEYIGAYSGVYGTGASSNRFFPALGNHDFYGGYEAHLAYFNLPGNERYYYVERGPVHVFVVNSEVNEPDGTSVDSAQAHWLSNRLASATAPWKLVFTHDPPYSSSSQASSRMRWPFREWGAHAVFGGSAHHYERILRDGFPYFVNGAGGASVLGFRSPPTEGSQVRYSAAHGAMLVTATAQELTFEFYSVANGGTRIDRHKISRSPNRPTLALRWVSSGIFHLSWSNSVSGRIESSPNPGELQSWETFYVPAHGSTGEQQVQVAVTNQTRFFRFVSP